MDHILAIDQGTTATTALIINSRGEIISQSSSNYQQHYPKPGWVDHHGDEIKKSIVDSVTNTLQKSGINKNSIAAIGITNQRETTCLFDKHNNPVRPFIVWQCRRSEAICEKLRQNNFEEKIKQQTGLTLDPYFSASKLRWYFDQDSELQKKASSGEILFGTIDSYLAHWLSGNKLHISDITNTSRTLLMNIKNYAWDPECLDIFGVPKECLPKIVKNTGPYGKTLGLDFLPDGIPIASLVGDQQGALVGQSCFQPGDIKATFGTGCFILMNTGEKPIFSQHGLLTSVAYQIDTKPIYCLEGSTFIAGAGVDFVRDTFGIIKNSEEIEDLAKQAPDSAGVIFVPALCGLGAPHWRADARGIITGLTRATTKAHIARATLEGIALQNTDVINSMKEDAQEIREIKVDGGAAKNNLLMQIQADLLNIRCIRSDSAQKTALGAAYLAGLALGIFPDINYIKKLSNNNKIFSPQINLDYTKILLKNYKKSLVFA